MTSGPAKILIVDDATSFAECAVEILSLRGYEVATAEDAESGLEMIERKPPNLIVMDSNLPGMRGEQATRLIRERLRQIPIVGMSAEDREVPMKEAGVDVFLSKPFEFHELLDVIEQLLLNPRVMA